MERWKQKLVDHHDEFTVPSFKARNLEERDSALAQGSAVVSAVPLKSDSEEDSKQPFEMVPRPDEPRQRRAGILKRGKWFNREDPMV